MKTSIFYILSLLLASNNALAEKYVPIIETPVYLTRTGISCTLFTSRDLNKKRDWCNAKASVDIRMTIAQMCSVQSSTTKGFTPDSKIVRFTIDSNKPGTGFHLVDNLQQGHSWKQSWANRRTYLGPFASSYDLWVRPVSGYIPKKVKDFPGNENKGYKHRDTHGYSIGINGSLSAEVGKEGLKKALKLAPKWAHHSAIRTKKQ